MLPSAAEIVARFLRANGYNETLAAFLKEANLPQDTGAVSTDNVTIEQILQEKKTFDVSLNFEKLGIHDGNEGWASPHPERSEVVSNLPSSSNILSTFVEPIVAPDKTLKSLLFATSADRRLSLLSAGPDRALLHSYTNLHNSPILSCLILWQKYVLSSSMAGTLSLFDLEKESLISTRHDHSKYVVRMAKWEEAAGVFVATTGWDGKVLVYYIPSNPDAQPKLDAPIASLTLNSNPEAVLFLSHPESNKPILLVATRDSTFLNYYSVPALAFDGTARATATLELLGRQNLAPHSNSWVAFTPSFVAPSPKDPTLVAVATSTTPHMKLMVVRLLIPPFVTQPQETAPVPLTQAAQGRAELAIQNREEAAIVLSCNTFAPQTVYSTPVLAWRPDGNGVWVSADDGTIRGIDTRTGKVAAKLLGHEPGSKIRTLWAGRVRADEGAAAKEEEWLVSGGFDQKLIVWRQK